MSNTLDKLSKVEIPNIKEILNSGKKTKSQMENISLNKVMVHFFYSDGRFKRTVEGTLMHIAEIPMVFIDYPSKLGFLVLDGSLIFDVTHETFELFVNENYTHTVNLQDFKKLDLDNDLTEMIEKINFIVPISAKQFVFKEIFVNTFENKTDKQITLLPTFLSSLGRAKLLENTTQTSNDGLIIVGVIGLLIGFIIGIIVTALVIL